MARMLEALKQAEMKRVRQDEGAPMAALLYTSRPTTSLPTYADALLAAFDPSLACVTLAASPTSLPAARSPQRDRDVAYRAAELSHDIARLDHLPGLVRPDLAADPHGVAGDCGVGETARRGEPVGVDIPRAAGRLHEGSMSRQAT